MKSHVKNSWYVIREVRSLGRLEERDRTIIRVTKIDDRSRYYPPKDVIKRKDKIVHEIYGEGIVEDVRGDRMLVLFFENGKEKRRQINLEE